MAPSAPDPTPLRALDLPERWGRHGPSFEQRRQQLLLATLPHERYHRGFHPACGSGALTAAVAGRCDRLLATEASDDGVRQSRARLAATPGVRVAHRRIPDQWPVGEEFDLVLLVEIGWFLPRGALTGLVDRVAGSLAPDGVVAACHWRHPPLDAEVSGERIHRRLRQHDRLAGLASYAEDRFIIDVLTSAGPGRPGGSPPRAP